MIPASSNMSSTFLQDGINTTGQTMPVQRVACERNALIENAMQTIVLLADKSSLDEVLTVLLSKSVPALNMYVTSQNEVPDISVNGLALQTAILRMTDIAAISDNLNINDYEATRLLECTEDDIIQKGAFQKKYIMPYDVQAAINLVIDEITAKHKRSGGSGKLYDIICELKASAPGNYFYGDNTQSFAYETNGGGGGVTYNNDHPDIANYDLIKGDERPEDTITPELIKEDGGGITGIIGFIDKAIQTVTDGVGNTATAIDATGDALDKLKGTVSDIGSDVASETLQKTIIKNLPLIIGVVVGITLLIIGIVYVTKNKSK